MSVYRGELCLDAAAELLTALSVEVEITLASSRGSSRKRWEWLLLQQSFSSFPSVLWDMNSYTCKPSATEKSERFFHFCCYSWGQTAYLNIGVSRKIPWNYRHTGNVALSTNIEDLKGSFLAIYFLSLDCYRIAGGRTKCKLLQQQNKLNINVYSNW